MKKTLLIVVIIAIVIIAGFLWWQLSWEEHRLRPITNFEECAAAGNPVMESYPRQCRTKDGRNFVEILPSPPPSSSPSSLNSGVSGIVLLGPTCPVIKNPPDPDCADKPYKTTVQVIEINSSKSSAYAVVESNDQGQYKVMLPSGEYALQPIGGNPLPRCETKNVIVEPSVIKEVNLSCDTGIR